MKTFGIAAMGLVAAAAGFVPPEALEFAFQDRGRPGPPRHRNPYLDLFDTNDDGELSKEEIDAASAVLRKLDRNGDGRLEHKEFPRPPRPGDRDDRRGPPRPGDRDGRGGPPGPPGPPPGDDDFRGPRDREGGRDDRRPPRRDERPRFDDERPRFDRRGEDRPARPERPDAAANVDDGEVLFIGGHETDRRDGGRPVALIAAALGVEPQVFRDAFSNVTPARGGDPSPALARRNKEVLMAALGEHGITNDRLDTVSNEYRYRPGSGRLWRHTPARARAVVEGGRIVRVEIIEHGSGYTTAPRVRIMGHEDVEVRATIAFDTDFGKNGRITSLEID